MAERSFLTRVAWFLGEVFVALPLALYTNQRYLAGPAPAEAHQIPTGDWVPDEAAALLVRSEARIEGLESKAAGLATVCAIVAASIGVAIPVSWSDTTLAGRLILVIAAAYSVMSLWTPILLVGPVVRSTVTAATLRRATHHDDAQRFLANEKARAASDNDRALQRYSNLQAASRNDARNAVLLFAMWALLLLFEIIKK